MTDDGGGLALTLEGRGKWEGCVHRKARMIGCRGLRRKDEGGPRGKRVKRGPKANNGMINIH